MSDVIDEVEILDPEPHLAQLRWRVEDDHIILSKTGEAWEVPEDFPEELYSAIEQLPYDYLELGQAAASAKDETRMALRLQEAAEQALDEAEERLRQFETVSDDPDRQKRALATLTYDLEAACNLLIRISVALGIQPGGEFYNNIKNLVEKYGMKMKYAKDYAYSETVTPAGILSREILAQEALDNAPATIEINSKGKVELKPVLEEGSMPEFPELSEPTEEVDEESREWLKNE